MNLILAMNFQAQNMFEMGDQIEKLSLQVWMDATYNCQ